MCSFRSRVNPLASAIVFTLVATLTVAAGPVAAQEITGPGGCGELFGFASEPVPVAKSADGRTVLATVQWAYNADIRLCYLVLDTAATNTLRANPPAGARPPANPAVACHNAYRPARSFAREPVPVAKSADGRTVLATVQWAYNANARLCYLVLDRAATNTLRAARTIVWQSAGDSFSSGLGLGSYYQTVGSNQDGYCQRSQRAHGPLAADILRQRGHNISPGTESMTACTGHHVEQYFNGYRRGSVGAKSALWDQGRLDQGAPERADVLVMSFGGNDIGFSDLLADTSYINRLDNLLDPQYRCSGLRYVKDEPDRYACDLKIDGDLRGGIDDFYVRVVEKALTDSGHLYIVGYPNLIAPYSEWPAEFFGLVKECTPISLPVIGADAKRGLANEIDAIARHFNSILKRAVGRANAELGGVRVHYLDLYRLYRTGTHQTIAYTSEHGRDEGAHPAHDYGTGGSHEYCGKKATRTWLMGLGPSFLHPNAEGHRITARVLADLIEETHPHFNAPPDPSTGRSLRRQADALVFDGAEVEVAVAVGVAGQF